MTRSKQALVQAYPNVQKQDILSITLPLINRLRVEEKADQTIKSYVRAVERLVRFHDLVHPREMDVDEVLDFLVHLKGFCQNQTLWLAECKDEIQRSAISQTISGCDLCHFSRKTLYSGFHPYDHW